MNNHCIDVSILNYYKNRMKGCHLYRLLRPELVKTNPTPLCSDSFSMWKIDNIDDYHRDIVEATTRLEIEVCREVCIFYI